MNNALAIYRDYYLQVLILEILVIHDGKIITDNLLPETIKRTRRNPTASWSITVPDLLAQTRFLHNLGLIKVEGKMIIIEERGIEALRNGTFQNMASTAFFNHKTLSTATLALYVSIAAAAFALLALFT